MCGAGQAFWVRSAQRGPPSVRGDGRDQKPETLTGAKGCFLSEGEQKDTFICFQLLVKFLLAQEAEKYICLRFNKHKKAEAVMLSPFSFATALRGGRFKLPLPKAEGEIQNISRWWARLFTIKGKVREGALNLYQTRHTSYI